MQQKNLSVEDFASMIDHTNLKATANSLDIENLCREALENGFASVCVNPVHVPLAAELLAASPVKVCTVVGFPLGAMSHEAKAAEAALAVSQGAQEIDMVVDIGAIRDNRLGAVEEDIARVVKAASPALVKVILEVCYLDDEQIIQVCNAAVRAGANFVKTSTGFGTAGATAKAVNLMRKTVGPDIGVKAAGGIKTLQDALAMIDAGANRLGCSSSLLIMQQMQQT